jgi:hypothetical protein
VVITEVTNLATGAKITYSLPPEEAVVCAHEQSKGNYNTWDYSKKPHPLLRDAGRFVSCGDWTAKK